MALSQEALLMLGLWRKAGKSEEPLELVLPTKADATRMRFALYNAAKPIRTGKQVDAEVLAAVESLSVRAVENKVIFAKKSASALIEAALAALGEDGVEGALVKPKTPLEVAAETSLQSVLGRLAENEPKPEPTRATPYYRREG